MRVKKLLWIARMLANCFTRLNPFEIFCMTAVNVDFALYQSTQDQLIHRIYEAINKMAQNSVQILAIVTNSTGFENALK